MKLKTTIILASVALAAFMPSVDASLIVNVKETKSLVTGTWKWDYDYGSPDSFMFVNDWAYLTFGIEWGDLRIDAITYNDTDFGGRARWYYDWDDYGALSSQVDYDPSSLVRIDGDFAERSWTGTFSIRRIGSSVPEGGSSLGMLAVGMAALGATCRRLKA